MPKKVRMGKKRAEYYKGYRFERQVRDRLRGQGFVVVRGAASKPIDLVAFKDGYVVVVECRSSPEKYNLERMRAEVGELYAVYKVPSALAVRDDLGIAWAIALPLKYNYTKLLASLSKALGDRFIRVEAPGEGGHE